MTGEAGARDRRRDILVAATHEFAARGYVGARVDDIVARAEVSKNLAYHYFGSKEGLFIAVVENVYARLMLYLSDPAIRHMEPVAAMEHIVRSVHRTFLAHPEVIPLLNSENLHRASRIARSEAVRTMRNPLLESLVDVLERGAAVGLFRQDTDPLDLYISVCGLCWFHLSNAHTMGMLLGQDLLRPERLARREDHVVGVVLGYLGARPAQWPGREDEATARERLG